METVRTKSQIVDNLLRLAAYARSENLEEQNFYKDLIRRGRCLVLMEHGEQLLIGPSRFVGYANKDLQKHSDEKGDGKITNPAISEILGPLTPSPLMEAAYLGLCGQLGIEPSQHSRTYWLCPNS